MEYNDRNQYNSNPVSPRLNKYDSKYDRNRSDRVPPSVKVDMSNLKKEVGELKTRLFNMEQYFSPERPLHTWKKITIVFAGGEAEDFTNVSSRKYTIEATNSKGNKVIIQKSSMRYMRVTEE